MNRELLNGIEEEFLQKSAQERACTIVNQYFFLVEIHLGRGEKLPGHIKELFANWLHDPVNDPAKDLAVTQALIKMTTDVLVIRGRKTYWSIDEVSAIYGLSPWTIRMWVDRFSLLRPCPDDKGDIRFRLEDVKRIGVICLLTGVRNMTLEDVRKYLESGDASAEPKEPVL